MPNKDLKNKRILITGITGFVGSNLAIKLRALGADVYGVSRSQIMKKNLKATIIDYSLIDEYVKKNKITIGFHLAAEALVESGNSDPYQTFKINTIGTLNMLEIARKNNFERIIIASTAHVYSNNRVPYKESYTPKPSRPYETSKACTDLIATSYAETFNLPVLIPRFVNIYGPGDMNFTRLIPKTIKSVLQGENPTMWGGAVTRDYLFIDDAIDAYVKLAQVKIEKIGKNKIFNFGSNNLVSVKDLIERIIVLSGQKVKIERIADAREAEIVKQYVSWNKAKRILNWKPHTELSEGLRQTIMWYKKT